MRINIYHICEDEKFINSAIEQFESCFPTCNSFYVLSNANEQKFNHIKSRDFVCTIVPEDLMRLSSNIPTKTIVVLHSLTGKFMDFVLALPEEIKIIWLCFGFEVYNDQHYFKEKSLLDTITQIKFPNPKISIQKKLKDELRPFYRLLKPSLALSAKVKKRKAMERINYFGCPFLEEYKSITELIGIKRPLFSFCYYPLEIIINTEKSIVFPKSKLIIGNSGHKTGNHLDVFDKIKHYPTNIPVVVPLNYGTSSYINAVHYDGKKHFKNRFIPLEKFMPLEEYNSILENVGVAILNNKRQQAVGNTIALLWFGSKIFLSNKNPFYNYLKRVGIEVYCYETELNALSMTEFLTLEAIEKNRTLLHNELNKFHLTELLKQQILQIYE